MRQLWLDQYSYDRAIAYTVMIQRRRFCLQNPPFVSFSANCAGGLLGAIGLGFPDWALPIPRRRELFGLHVYAVP